MATGLLLVVLVLVIVAGAAAAYFIFSNGTVGIGSAKTLAIGSIPTVIRIGSYQYTIAFHGQNSGGSTAYLYVGRSPVLMNPTLNVTVPLNSTTNINWGTSGYAVMQIKLDSINGQHAYVTVTPLQSSLSIPVDYNRIKVIGAAAGSYQGSAGSTTNSTPKTTSTTTTINQTLSAQQRAMQVLQSNEWYPVMVNETTLYANTTKCTPSVYNSSYIGVNSHAPQPPLDYWNVSTIAPYAITLNLTNAGKGNYAATYSTLSQSSYTTGRALQLIINISTSSVVNVTESGIFQGLGFSDIQSIVQRAQSVGNACGIEVVV